jgi:hypothetical protein
MDRNVTPANVDAQKEGAASSSPADPAAGEGEPALAWAVWPLKENLSRSAAVILFLAVVVWAVASWFGPEWIFPSVVILFLFLAGFFLPTFYRMDLETVSVRGFLSRKKRAWTKLKSYHVGNKGVHLSSYSQRTRLEGLHGLYIPFGDKRKEILDFIGEKMDHGR